MKRFLNKYLFLLLVAVPFAANAQTDPQVIFEQANQLYQQHQYDSAVQKYMQLVAEGYRNEALFYNTANAYFKNNQNAEAIYYYEEALQSNPANEVIRHNLQLAQEKVTDLPDTPPEMQLKKWGREITLLLSPNTWMAGSLVFYLLFMLLLGLWIFSSFRKKGIIWAMVGLGLLTLFFFIVSYARYEQLMQQNNAIVMQEAVAHTAPDADSQGSFDVHEGYKVQLLNEVGKWEKIKLSDGKTGWINTDVYKVL